ncbi:deoxyribonuclease-1-like [Mytilus trossulus]|uniref:deoxyribonuclease-1-like n=1 Tax=Mytilus trossulus TaxID=6551 RepID=UPI003005D79B
MRKIQSFSALNLGLLLFILTIATQFLDGAAQSLEHRSPRSGHPILAGAFNLNQFNQDKMNDPEVANFITHVITRYDLILIQEVTDLTGNALNALWSMVNRTDSYGMIVSAPVGRTSSKEQYAYFYRLLTLQLVNEHLFDDSLHDWFESDPYTALFEVRLASSHTKFAAIGFHANPLDAVNEMGHLHDVYYQTMNTWGEVNALTMGNFYADCEYANAMELMSKPIYYDRVDYHWYIESEVDTTTNSTTDCAFDRIIGSGITLQMAVIPGTSNVFQFSNNHQLPYEKLMNVTDNYPVEIQLNFF